MNGKAIPIASIRINPATVVEYILQPSERVRVNCNGQFLTVVDGASQPPSGLGYTLAQHIDWMLENQARDLNPVTEQLIKDAAKATEAFTEDELEDEAERLRQEQEVNNPE